MKRPVLWATSQCLSLLLAFVLPWCQGAWATTVMEMDLPALVTAADRIVVARCVDVRSKWVGGKIYSDVDIAVEQDLIGSAASNYTVTSLGGTAMHPSLKVPVTMTVSGGLQFSVDEEMLLFTKQDRLGRHQVVGLSQGKFSVATDRNSGRKFIPLGDKKLETVPTHSGRAVSVKGKSLPQQGAATTIKQREVDLEEFIQDIRSEIHASKKPVK